MPRLHRGRAREGTGAATAAPGIPGTSFNPSGSGWSCEERQGDPRVLVLAMGLTPPGNRSGHTSVKAVLGAPRESHESQRGGLVLPGGRRAAGARSLHPEMGQPHTSASSPRAPRECGRNREVSHDKNASALLMHS